jgi:hypothetical protein
MTNNNKVRLRNLEKQSHMLDNHVLVINEAKDGTYWHDDGRPVTPEELQRAQVVVIDDIGYEGDESPAERWIKRQEGHL